MDGKDIAETAENKASAEALDRARLARERREAEQRKRLDELRAHAAAAQAQREKRDEDRRRRQAEQRARDDDRRQQVEERKRAIWEASVSRREALLQRERERNERLDRSRAARSTQNSCFAFGSSTPRLLEPQDSSSYFWAARSTIPLDEMNFFQSLAASTTNVMFASAPLTRPASALQLNFSDNDSKDESDRPAPLVMWSPVARRRTDLVPTLPVPRAPGRAYSMTRLDKIPTQRPLHSASPSMHHLNRTQTRSGDSSSGSRPESALSNAGGVLRRTSSFPRKPRPASIAGTGVNTPRGGAGGDSAALSAATSPSVSRDSTVMAGGDVPRRPRVPPRPRPLSSHITTRHTSGMSPGDGKPPPHRKLKPASDDKATRGKSRSPGRTLSPSPADSKEPSVDKEINNKIVKPVSDKNQVSAIEVTQKLEALHIQNGDEHPQAPNQNIDKVRKNATETNAEQKVDNEPIEMPKAVEEKPNDAPKNNEKKDKIEESEMTASMSGKRITTEEEAKAALAERRRRAREELEKQAEINRAREELEKEAQAERLRLEEERQRREEEEAKELAQLQRKMEEEKLRKAIEAQQQLEREEAERKAREEIERQARLKEDEEKRKATEEAEKLRKEEAEREEKERLARKQRVEAIMARTRLKKAEEEKNKQENKGQPAQPAVSAAAFPAAPTAQPDNGNTVVADDVPDCGLDASQTEAINTPHEDAPNAVPSTTTESNPVPNNGNVTVDLLGKSEKNNIEPLDLKTYPLDLTTRCQEILDNSTNANVPAPDTNKGNNIQQPSSVGHISANFIQTERMSAAETKIPENVPKLIEDDFTAHNGHGTPHNHPLTLQNAI